MPLKSIGNETPFFRLYNNGSSLDFLRVCSCLCYVATPKLHQTKFLPHAKPCIFISYPAHKKAYKVLDLATFEIFVSRDIVLMTNTFHFISCLNFLKQFFFITSTFIPAINTVH